MLTKFILTTTKYAKRCDEVQVVSDRGTACIVEDSVGSRFSVRSDLLGEEEPEPEIIIVEQEVKPQLSLF